MQRGRDSCHVWMRVVMWQCVCGTMSLWVCGATRSLSRQNMTMCMWSCDWVYMRDSRQTWMSHEHVYVYVCDVTRVAYEWVPTICMSMCMSICVTWLMSQMNQSWLCVCLCVWHDSCHKCISPDYVYVYVCDMTHVTNESVLIMCMSLCVTWLMSYMSQSWLCVYLCVWRDSCDPWVSHNYVYAYVCDRTHVTYEWITIICAYLCVSRDHNYMCISMCVTWLLSYMNESRCMRHYMTMCHVLRTNSVKYEVLSHV